jgi:hypothetical protein
MREFVFLLLGMFLLGFIVGICAMEVFNPWTVQDVAKEIERMRAERIVLETE